MIAPKRSAEEQASRSNVFNIKTKFRRSLLAWHRKHGRDLPWRRTRSPYAILVSEIMLQQTQVATVIPFYEKWMRHFPSVEALAAACETDVLRAWQGLGYYSRARNLHATARMIMKEYAGSLPTAVQSIRQFPGAGRYTANAIATFAFNRSVPVVEANTARLLARFFNLQIPIDSNRGQRALWQMATDLLPKRDAGLHNTALMDLGAMVCSTRPNCLVCPVQALCQAKDPSQIPLRKPRPAIRLLTEHHSFITLNRRVLLERSLTRWNRMWILPRLSAVPKKAEPIFRSTFPFTNHRISLVVFDQPPNKQPFKSSHRWFSIDSLGSIPLPSPHRRALEVLVSTQTFCDPASQT